MLFLIFPVILVEGRKFPPLSIISSQGLCKSTPSLNKYYKASLFENSPNSVSDMAVVNVLDCTVHNEDCIFANRLLNSDFTNSNNGAYFYLEFGKRFDKFICLHFRDGYICEWIHHNLEKLFRSHLFQPILRRESSRFCNCTAMYHCRFDGSQGFY